MRVLSGLIELVMWDLSVRGWTVGLFLAVLLFAGMVAQGFARHFARSGENLLQFAAVIRLLDCMKTGPTHANNMMRAKVSRDFDAQHILSRSCFHCATSTQLIWYPILLIDIADKKNKTLTE